VHAFTKFGASESSDNKIDHDALRRHFTKGITTERLQESNRLSEEDHQQLLHAFGHQQVLALVLKGLATVWSNA
jgi:hypothetical protein